MVFSLLLCDVQARLSSWTDFTDDQQHIAVNVTSSHPQLEGMQNGKELTQRRKCLGPGKRSEGGMSGELFGSLGYYCPDKCTGMGECSRKIVQGNDQITMQDYKSLRAANIICATYLVNTSTHRRTAFDLLSEKSSNITAHQTKNTHRASRKKSRS